MSGAARDRVDRAAAPGSASRPVIDFDLEGSRRGATLLSLPGQTSQTSELDSQSRPIPGAPRRALLIASFAESLISFRGHLLQALKERGYEIFTLAPADPETGAKLAALGVRHLEIPLDRAGLSPWRDARTLCALIGRLRALRPDLVLAYTIKPVIYGSLAARLAGVPAMFSLISGAGAAAPGESGSARAVSALTRLLYRCALPLNRRVFFQNPDDRGLFVRLGLVRRPDQAVLVSGSGVDLDRYQPAPLPEDVCFVLIARLLRRKGIYQFAEAARRVKAQHPQARFRLVGWFDEHPDRIDLRDLRAWVDAGVIEYLGKLEDVRPAIAASSVFVLPSFYPEGQPRSVLEAMAMGRPIITTDWPGCRETVEPGRNGFLVPPGEVDALTEAMRRFLQHPELIPAFGQESRDIAEARYDVHKVNRVMLEAMDLA